MDEWKVEANREMEGDYLVRKAALMTIEGVSFVDVKQWVSTNFQRDDPARHYWTEFSQHPEYNK